jgi:hypothetical protein
MGDWPRDVALDTGLAKGVSVTNAYSAGICRPCRHYPASCRGNGAKGDPTTGGTLDKWRLAYCANLREVAAGRKSEAGGLDLTAERARLAKLQADKVEIELAELRDEVVRLKMRSR